MPRRRTSIAPQTELQALMARVNALENQVKQLRQPGASSLQADDYEQETDPVPWQIMVHHPGTHIDATPESPIVYYHPGDEDVGGVTTPGFKQLGVTQQTSNRRQGRLVIKQGNSPSGPTFTVDPTTPITSWTNTFTWGSGPPDFPALKISSDVNGNPKIMQKGVYLVMGSCIFDPYASGAFPFDRLAIMPFYDGTNGSNMIMLGSTTTPQQMGYFKWDTPGLAGDASVGYGGLVTNLLVVYGDAAVGGSVKLWIAAEPAVSEVFAASLAVQNIGDI